MNFDNTHAQHTPENPPKMNTIFWEEGIGERQRRALLLERVCPVAYAADAFSKHLMDIFKVKHQVFPISHPII